MSEIQRKVDEKLPKNTRLILMGEYGSSAHGVAIESSDHDYMGVAMEPKSAIFGLDSYEHTVLKDGEAGEATAAGGVEGTVYALRKFVKLASEGNTSVVSLLHLPEYAVMDELGAKLHARRELFQSRQALKRFAAHLTREKRRMTGELAEKVLRPELVTEFGYDTKAAYQAMKLAFHGRRYALTGALEIPFPLEERQMILDIRAGKIPAAEVRDYLEETVEFLDGEAARTDFLPEYPQRAALNKLLEELYEEAFYSSSRESERG